MSHTIIHHLAGTSGAAALIIGGAAFFAPAASAASTATKGSVSVPATCQTDLFDEVGLANNMLAAAQTKNFSLFQLNSQASVTIDPATACASVLTASQDDTLLGADVDLPDAEIFFSDGVPADAATAVQKVDSAISVFESTQRLLGLPVGGSVPEPTPPNPNIPQACRTDLDVWAGDANNMLTAAEGGQQSDVTTIENNLSAIEEFPAASDCLSVTTSTQHDQLVTAEGDFSEAASLAEGGDFTDAATDISAAKTIVADVESGLGLFITI